MICDTLWVRTLAPRMLVGEWNSSPLPTALPLAHDDPVDLQGSACQLRVLGDFSLTIHNNQIAVGRTITEMLALLGIAGGMSRERMQSILWPSVDPELAGGRLRSLIYRVRQISCNEIVTSEPTSSVGLNPAVLVDFQIASAAAIGLAYQDP